MSSIARTSADVNRYGDMRGREDWSLSAHALCRRRQTWNRLGDIRRNLRTARNGKYSRARSTAHRIPSLARPSGRRPTLRLNPEVRSRASTSRSNAASFWTRRRSLATSCRSSGSVRSATSRQTTTVGAAPSHPAPSSEELRVPWRWSRPSCVGRDSEAGGRSAAERDPWSSWG